MAADPGKSLEFHATHLSGKGERWDATKVEAALSALAEAGLRPEGGDGVDVARWAKEADGKHPRRFTGTAGAHEVVLDRKGDWVLSTPAATLMMTRYDNRPEAAKEHVAAVRALLPVSTPYFGMDRYASQVKPHWLKPSTSFRAQRLGPTTFLSAEYLAANNGGEPLPDPPVDADERVAGGQLLVAAVTHFGEVTDLSDTLDRWLLKVQPA